MVGQIAKNVRELLEEGQPEEHVSLAVRMLAERGAPPAELPATLIRAARAVERRKLAEFIQANGGRWPTGCALRRGTHGAQHIPHPLGYERTPSGWPHATPNRAQVSAALDKLPGPEERSQSGRSK